MLLEILIGVVDEVGLLLSREMERRSVDNLFTFIVVVVILADCGTGRSDPVVVVVWETGETVNKTYKTKTCLCFLLLLDVVYGRPCRLPTPSSPSPRSW